MSSLDAPLPLVCHVSGSADRERVEPSVDAGLGGVPVVLNPAILVMQSAQDWATKNVPGAIDGARDRRIFLQGEMRAGPLVIFNVPEQRIHPVSTAGKLNLRHSKGMEQSFGP